MFRSDHFAPTDIARLTEAIIAMRTATVDVSVLQNVAGHATFLAGLISRELNAPDAADTVVFLGPTSRYGSKIPNGGVPSQSSAHTRFFYIKCEAQQAVPARSGRPGSSSGTDQWTGESLSDPTVPKTYDVVWPASSGSAQGQPDIITAAVSELKGKTLIIHTPADLAKAIHTIERKP